MMLYRVGVFPPPSLIFKHTSWDKLAYTRKTDSNICGVFPPSANPNFSVLSNFERIGKVLSSCPTALRPMRPSTTNAGVKWHTHTDMQSLALFRSTSNIFVEVSVRVQYCVLLFDSAPRLAFGVSCLFSAFVPIWDATNSHSPDRPCFKLMCGTI